jgi:IclR family acetate operon transcriptional repressor
MVERTPAGNAYRLGPELLALGGRAQGAGELRAAAHAELFGLAHETRETATLEVLTGREVLILDEAIGGHVIGSRPSVGTRWAAHATSTGKVLLAHLPDGALGALLQQPLPALTPRTVTEPGALRRELARVRERGSAVTTEELEPGYVAVAAPVRSAPGAVVAALSVGGPKARFGAERVALIARRLQGAAARVSARLGFNQARPAPARPAAGRIRR